MRVLYSLKCAFVIPFQSYIQTYWGIVEINRVVGSCWQLNLLPFHFSEFNLTSDTETFGHLISSNSCIYISVCWSLEYKCFCSSWLLTSHDCITLKLFYTIYRVSELRVVELLDGLCEKMEDYTLKVLSYFTCS